MFKTNDTRSYKQHICLQHCYKMLLLKAKLLFQNNSSSLSWLLNLRIHNLLQLGSLSLKIFVQI